MSKTHDQHDGRYIEDQREFFDRLTTQDWDIYSNPAWDKAREKEVRGVFEIAGDNVKTVLDVGCGCGYHDVSMAKRQHIESVIGVDYSQNSILQAEKYYSHPKVSRKTLDIFNEEETKSYLKKFDLVCSYSVIEHLSDPMKFLEVIKSFSKENGFIAIITPNWKKLENRLRAFLGLKYGFCDPLHFKEYDLNELISMGNKIGLTFQGAFGHTFQLMVKQYTPINIPWGFTYKRFPYLVQLSNFIGIVYKKQN